MLAIRALEKPVIAAVNGVCAGAGLSLACVCDFRIAADNASFVPGFIGIGLVPDAGGTYFLHRLLGASRAFEWMSSNRRLSAAEAQAWGLVSEVVAADALAARAAELAATYAALPTRGIGMTKRLFDHAATATLEEQLELEAQLQAAATQTEDFQEGVAAFLEKRAPEFKGADTGSERRADVHAEVGRSLAALAAGELGARRRGGHAGKSRRCALSPRAARPWPRAGRPRARHVPRRRRSTAASALELAERRLVERQRLVDVLRRSACTSAVAERPSSRWRRRSRPRRPA